MDTNPVCPICGKPMVPGAPQGLCPECLMKSGFETKTGNEPAGGKLPFVPPSVAEIAKLFPQLEIIELLGQGGMGAVYKARQPRLNRLVALKILAPEKQNDPQFAERFEREARALAALTHPNIVTVYDSGEAQGIFYLLMEFVDGLTLRQLLRARRLASTEALAIVPQICQALQYAHEQGIIHRDIKPENILLDKNGRVKIADFGIAKLLDQDPQNISLTGAADVVGTPHYMAPEQIEQPQTVDHRADIYSLGVVFYEMLTGELPLGKFQSPSQKVQIDVRLDEVVLHSLEKEPERRYQTASQVRTAVETIAATPGASSPSISRTMPSIGEKTSAWKIAVVIGGVGLVLLAVLVCVALLLFGKKHESAGPAATAPVKISGTKISGLTIRSAEFGMGNHMADVTARVIELLDSQPDGFIVNAQSLGIDPKPGRGKSLTIRYDYKGDVHTFSISSRGKVSYQTLAAQDPGISNNFENLLNADQRLVLQYINLKFGRFSDERTFDGWSPSDRAALERRLLDAIKGPRSDEYYQAINSLAALRSTNALPLLEAMAFDHKDTIVRLESSNRHRWMAIRAMGVIGDKTAVPEMIHLLYHNNSYVRWSAQISLVRLTGQNFSNDWQAWGKWWNEQQGNPPFNPEVVHWWRGQAEPHELAKELAEADRKLMDIVEGKKSESDSPDKSTDVIPE